MKKIFTFILLFFPLLSFAQFNLDAEITRLADKYHAKLDTCDTHSGGGCSDPRADLFLLIKNKLQGNTDAEAILATIECESGFSPVAVGDQGDSLGLVQINKPAWPTITRQQAFDPNFSLDFMIEQFRLGHRKYWTCYRLFARRNGILLASK